MAGDADAAREWEDARQRVTALLQAADADQLSSRVPACPDWTVHQLLSHMVGLDADVLADDEDPGHSPEWTQRQVDARNEVSTEQVLAEWAELAPALATRIADTDPRPLGDVIIHEQDLRGALDAPGAQDTAGLASIRDAMAQRFADSLGDLAPVRFESGDFSWSSGDGEPGVVLAAGGFDAFRAFTSRRSAAELRSWVTSGDVEPYLPVFGGLGDLPSEALPGESLPQ